MGPSGKQKNLSYTCMITCCNVLGETNKNKQTKKKKKKKTNKQNINDIKIQ